MRITSCVILSRGSEIIVNPIRFTGTCNRDLYRTSDELLAHPIGIEKKLRNREPDLFSLSRKVILYEATNSHFEALSKKTRTGARFAPWDRGAPAPH